MTDSSGGPTPGPSGVAMSESWTGGSFSGGHPNSNAFDPAGNQEHWSGRMPPQDSDAEQSVLGSMLISKDAIADVNEQIGGGDFYRPAHETIYDAIVDLYGRGEPADPVTVSAELHRRGELQKVGGAPYLHTLSASVPIAANAGYYATIVREKAILRRLVDAGTKIAQMGYAQEGDVDQTVDAAQQEVYAIGEKRAQEDYAPLSAIME
ncbi:MAG: dnaB, partial [Mycobacterium sp.]|nr:dnaB [Mycobacterium sp.]